MEKHIVKKEIKIKAVPEAVWDAITNPDKTKEYFFNAKVHSSWKEGSRITFKGKMFFFISFEMKGKILEIIPNKHLIYTLKNSESDGASLVTYKLVHHNGETTVTVTDDVGQEDGAEKRYKKSVKGWEKVLNGMKELVEESDETVLK